MVATKELPTCCMGNLTAIFLVNTALCINRVQVLYAVRYFVQVHGLFVFTFGHVMFCAVCCNARPLLLSHVMTHMLTHVHMVAHTGVLPAYAWWTILHMCILAQICRCLTFSNLPLFGVDSRALSCCGSWNAPCNTGTRTAVVEAPIWTNAHVNTWWC